VRTTPTSRLIRLCAPRWWLGHLVVAGAVALAGWLGLWQLHAWQAHRAAAAVDVTELTPIELRDALGPDDPFPGKLAGQPVVVEGEWVPEATLFVSGRERGDRDGFWVVTPVTVAGTESAMLVVRGWAPAVAEAPAPPTGGAEFVGWLQPPEGSGEVDDDPTDDVLPQLRIADAIQHLDQDVYGAYVVVADQVVAGDWPVGERATNDGTAGLIPATLDQRPTSSRFTALRNLLYALQWWLFGGFAVFVWGRYLLDSTRDPVPSTT
jgi:surfeit locus 1 family protein